jgi:hypothetical protein
MIVLIVIGVVAVFVSAGVVLVACMASARFSRAEEEHELPIYVRRSLSLARKRGSRGVG